MEVCELFWPGTLEAVKNGGRRLDAEWSGIPYKRIQGVGLSQGEIEARSADWEHGGLQQDHDEEVRLSQDSDADREDEIHDKQELERMEQDMLTPVVLGQL